MQRERIKVFGMGGGGCNAINRLMPALAPVAELWAVNTDAEALAASPAERRLQLGGRLLRGLGASGNPSLAMRAAEEGRADLAAAVAGAEVVVVLAGLGGGTGTGASPALAAAARAAGAVVAAVVTTPFAFEGRRRELQAEAGREALREQVDLLAVLPNDALLAVLPGRASMQEAFALGDGLPAAFVARLAALGAGPHASAVHAALADAAGTVAFALPPLWVRPGLPPAPSGLSPALGTSEGRTGLEPSL